MQADTKVPDDRVIYFRIKVLQDMVYDVYCLVTKVFSFLRLNREGKGGFFLHYPPTLELGRPTLKDRPARQRKARQRGRRASKGGCGCA